MAPNSCVTSGVTISVIPGRAPWREESIGPQSLPLNGFRVRDFVAPRNDGGERAYRAYPR